MKLITNLQNRVFCKKYPFWRATNVWTNEYEGYDYTWYDDIPEGWRKAFGIQLSEEIKQAGETYLKAHPDKAWRDILQWEQIKEKYGTLRLYASAIKEIQDILLNYDEISTHYCINCGKPSKYVTSGWVSFICEDCLQKYLKRSPKLRYREIKKDKKDVD